MNAIESPVSAFLQRPSMVDFPGQMAAVFFTSGCNFRCGFCHNSSLINQKMAGISWERLEDVSRDFQNDWVTGVVVSGGEPTICEDLPELLQFFKDFGFAVKLDTNGSNPEMLQKCLPLVDYVAMDLKTSLEKYPELVGWKNPQKIRDSIRLIIENAKDYEFRTTVIESHHSPEIMASAANEISGAQRLILQAFVPKDDLLDLKLRAEKRTSFDHLNLLKEVAQQFVEDVSVLGA